jgi:F420-0:gamma-glutamyl ligase
MSVPLTSQQEALAQELAQAIQQAATDDILQMARMLVAAEERQLFGNTEFRIRDLALQIAAKAYNTHLAEKKTATTAAAFPARTATALPPTTATGPANS